MRNVINHQYFHACIQKDKLIVKENLNFESIFHNSFEEIILFIIDSHFEINSQMIITKNNENDCTISQFEKIIKDISKKPQFLPLTTCLNNTFKELKKEKGANFCFGHINNTLELYNRLKTNSDDLLATKEIINDLNLLIKTTSEIKRYNIFVNLIIETILTVFRNIINIINKLNQSGDYNSKTLEYFLFDDDLNAICILSDQNNNNIQEKDNIHTTKFLKIVEEYKKIVYDTIQSFKKEKENLITENFKEEISKFMSNFSHNNFDEFVEMIKGYPYPSFNYPDNDFNFCLLILLLIRKYHYKQRGENALKSISNDQIAKLSDGFIEKFEKNNSYAYLTSIHKTYIQKIKNIEEKEKLKSIVKRFADNLHNNNIILIDTQSEMISKQFGEIMSELSLSIDNNFNIYIKKKYLQDTENEREYKIIVENDCSDLIAQGKTQIQPINNYESKLQKDQPPPEIPNCIYLPYFPNGDLNYFLKYNHSILTKNDRIIMIYQIGKVLEDLHKEDKFYHGNLSNLCFFIDSKLTPYLARILSKQPNENDSVNKFLYYTSPEFIDNKDNLNDCKAQRLHDIYSYGILIYEIITGQNPECLFGRMGLEERKKKIREGLFDFLFPSENSDSFKNNDIINNNMKIINDDFPEFKEIIQGCLQKDVNRRFQSMSDVCKILKSIKIFINNIEIDTRLKETIKSRDYKFTFYDLLEYCYENKDHENCTSVIDKIVRAFNKSGFKSIHILPFIRDWFKIIKENQIDPEYFNIISRSLLTMNLYSIIKAYKKISSITKVKFTDLIEEIQKNDEYSFFDFIYINSFDIFYKFGQNYLFSKYGLFKDLGKNYVLSNFCPNEIFNNELNFDISSSNNYKYIVNISKINEQNQDPTKKQYRDLYYDLKPFQTQQQQQNVFYPYFKNEKIDHLMHSNIAELTILDRFVIIFQFATALKDLYSSPSKIFKHFLFINSQRDGFLALMNEKQDNPINFNVSLEQEIKEFGFVLFKLFTNKLADESDIERFLNDNNNDLDKIDDLKQYNSQNLDIVIDKFINDSNEVDCYVKAREFYKDYTNENLYSMSIKNIIKKCIFGIQYYKNREYYKSFNEIIIDLCQLVIFYKYENEIEFRMLETSNNIYKCKQSNCIYSNLPNYQTKEKLYLEILDNLIHFHLIDKIREKQGDDANKLNEVRKFYSSLIDTVLHDSKSCAEFSSLDLKEQLKIPISSFSNFAENNKITEKQAFIWTYILMNELSLIHSFHKAHGNISGNTIGIYYNNKIHEFVPSILLCYSYFDTDKNESTPKKQKRLEKLQQKDVKNLIETIQIIGKEKLNFLNTIKQKANSNVIVCELFNYDYPGLDVQINELTKDYLSYRLTFSALHNIVYTEQSFYSLKGSYLDITEILEAIEILTTSIVKNPDKTLGKNSAISITSNIDKNNKDKDKLLLESIKYKLYSIELEPKESKINNNMPRNDLINNNENIKTNHGFHFVDCRKLYDTIFKDKLISCECEQTKKDCDLEIQINQSDKIPLILYSFISNILNNLTQQKSYRLKFKFNNNLDFQNNKKAFFDNIRIFFYRYVKNIDEIPKDSSIIVETAIQ